VITVKTVVPVVNKNGNYHSVSQGKKEERSGHYIGGL
jgi:hypothetical protein